MQPQRTNVPPPPPPVAPSSNCALLTPAALRAAFRLTKGYRLAPWKSPYLRWRIETWSGIEADSITPRQFIEFVWAHRRDFMRYLRWAAAKSHI